MKCPQAIFCLSRIKPSKNGAWLYNDQVINYKGLRFHLWFSEASFFWKHPAAFACPVFSVHVCICVCTMSGLRSASFTFMCAFDIKQSKYWRHYRAEGRNLGIRWCCTACWLSSLIPLCTAVQVLHALVYTSVGVMLHVMRGWLLREYGCAYCHVWQG